MESDSSGFSPDEEETQDWIMTYADLMTLLLVFFVLLFSISSLNMKRFKAAIASIQASWVKPRRPSASWIWWETTGCWTNPPAWMKSSESVPARRIF